MSQRQYEMMVIVDPEVDERAVAPLIDKFFAVVTNEGGTVDDINIWGRRRFAYEINKRTEGTYVVAQVTAEPTTVDEVDRLLGLNEQILRTKVLRAEDARVVLNPKLREA